MGERSRLQLAFGGGLDRATGTTSRDPARYTDLRNVRLFEGKAQARRGLSRVATMNSGGIPTTNVVNVRPLRVSRQGLVTVHEVAAGKIWAYTTAADGSGQSLIATAIMTLPTSTDAFWQILAAESNNLTFFAHTHGPIAGRHQTRIYNNGTGTVTDLQANLNGLGAAAVFFRGVQTYLAYLVGWGYGSATDTDRPEVVRISLPGQPNVFNAEHYFLAGQRGDPVLACAPLGKELLVLKETEIYAITGYDRATFGIEPRDVNYGIAGPRLWVEVEGTLYFWSLHGPRMTQGGPSVDIGRALDLGAPEPSDLIADADVRSGFAAWSAQEREVRFHFGRRQYTLHLEDASKPRWSYTERQVLLRCGGLFYGTGNVSADQLQLFYGQDGGTGLFKSDTGFQDDSVNYAALAKTVPACPAGPDGECVFPALWLTVVYTMAVTIRVTPVVDGVDQPSRNIVLTSKASRTLDTFEVALYQAHSPGGTEQTRVYPRGTYFSVKLDTLVGGVGAVATGDLIVEHLAIEYEAVRESRVAI